MTVGPAQDPLALEKQKVKIKLKVTQEEEDLPSKFEEEKEDSLRKKKEELPAKPMKKRKKERFHRIVDTKEELGRLQQELKASRPQKERKLMRGFLPVHDTQEQLYEQHRLHNQGARMVAQEGAQQAPPIEQAAPVENPPPEAKHGSNQEPPLQVPGGRLLTLGIS